MKTQEFEVQFPNKHVVVLDAVTPMDAVFKAIALRIEQGAQSIYFANSEFTVLNTKNKQQFEFRMNLIGNLIN